jgi:WD40 repeat protein
MAKTCGSILSIREDTVYFIHQSAKDYIVENAAQRIFPILHQHYKMFEASLDAMSNILNYNMYCLEDPAIHIDNVPLQDVGSDPFASIRYCCVFWVEHQVSGYHFEGFDYQKYLQDDQKLHLFLKEKFLCWIEFLALLRNFSPQAQIALQKLKNLIDCCCCGERNDGTVSTTQLQGKNEIQDLRHFVNDAYQFVRNSTECVAHWPLQLYFSAISFEQYSNVIRGTFEQTVRKKFGPSPILTSKRHGQSSFRLQSSFHAGRHHLTNDEAFNWLMFSPDSSLIGRLCVDYSGSGFAVWRADTGVLEHTFDITLDSKIAFFPNSHDFISVSETGIIKRWSMNKRSCVGQQSLHLDYLSGSSNLPLTGVACVGWNTPKERVIALSPKGDLVASWHRISTDGLGFAKIWDTYTACCRSSCEYGQAEYIFAAFSPNSQLLAVLYKDGVGVHDTKTGAVVQRINTGIGERGQTQSGDRLDNVNSPDCLCFSPDSKILATVEHQRQLYLWDTHTWELMRQIEMSLHPYSIQCFEISPDSVVLATGSSDGVKLWSVETGECVAQVKIYP